MIKKLCHEFVQNFLVKKKALLHDYIIQKKRLDYGSLSKSNEKWGIQLGSGQFASIILSSTCTLRKLIVDYFG